MSDCSLAGAWSDRVGVIEGVAEAVTEDSLPDVSDCPLIDVSDCPLPDVSDCPLPETRMDPPSSLDTLDIN